MKSHLKKNGLMLAMCLVVTNYAYAFGECISCAKEYTQILNSVRLLDSYIKQAEMVSNQLRNLENYASGEWTTAINALSQLNTIVKHGEALSYTMQDVTAVFNEKYPGYVAPEDYNTAYKDWSITTLDSVKGALRAAGFQGNEFTSEHSTMLTLQGLSNNAAGQMQAIQAGNMISAQLISQMQKMRQLQMSQMQAQDAYIAHVVNKEAAAEAASRRFFKRFEPSNASTYSKF